MQGAGATHACPAVCGACEAEQLLRCHHACDRHGDHTPLVCCYALHLPALTICNRDGTYPRSELNKKISSASLSCLAGCGPQLTTLCVCPVLWKGQWQVLPTLPGAMACWAAAYYACSISGVNHQC
jgi:hypothetical protein